MKNQKVSYNLKLGYAPSKSVYFVKVPFLTGIAVYHGLVLMTGMLKEFVFLQVAKK